jgi:hypothetical protein
MRCVDRSRPARIDFLPPNALPLLALTANFGLAATTLPEKKMAVLRGRTDVRKASDESC